MITFKQIDALYWIAELGSFEAAANKLNMSQSAISKRIQELEETFDVEIFDRSKRNARLTEKGAELLDYAKDLLERRDYLLERVSTREVLVRRFRLGVTELTAFTWLPALVEALREAYPKVQIEPSVELSSELFRKLESDELDLVIVPDAYSDSRFLSTPLGSVENAWMCAPWLVSEPDPVGLEALAGYTVLTQGSHSGTGLLYERWLAAHAVQMPRKLTSHNLLVQVGLALSGVGVSYLPKACLSHLIERGELRALETEPALPQVGYVALHRGDRQFGLNQNVAQLAVQCCDFSRLLF
ncbi:LysR family transcriptional regulator [Pseudomonas yamanorum]|jgi:DNA-binding transcriptional LysR family regulator|uniref:LysR family transcriptional regulator n=1 Tax=Pseudomonas yamanorum TaxID=515393 RepID=A0AAJ3LJJ3_9PSED|nr:MULTISPECIES: LysR family transcriptional regulator [Pseudomonas]MBK5411610.1 LysR family transcriptional regulator [Pseudomonas sp. TH34]MBV6665340.1 LysR family transcriptional regulator [Pseudomonas yamanorum]MDR0192115.1 LysR family transcriptional regulator [Pseudomonas yamanorum]NWD45428.1 LysR family transcriptional regulator [Pseudomonas yamanorum]WVN19096.1 LysR family transcriptional regulator [Pseudomonas yamanorum]